MPTLFGHTQVVIMVNLFVYLAVIVSGGSVLAIEILGTRILGPFYGVSVYLWSALISVTLAALSTGYAIGGRLADRGPTLKRFSVVIGLAGLWVVVIPWLRDPVLALTASAGLRAAVLLTATVLFFPPLAMLGIVSPYAIRLKASNISVVGRTAGNLYAVSTLAGVAAAVATGFLLIPSLGVNRLTLAVGAALVVTALIGLATARNTKGGVTALFLLPVAAVGLLLATPSVRTKENPQIGLLAVVHSAYAEIRVVEDDGARYLLTDGAIQNVVDAATGESLFSYVDVLDLTRLFFEEPGRMLLVGLGGGSLVKRFVAERWRVEAVEIDPVITRVAGDYFYLDEHETPVHHMDGRRFLSTTEETFDVVIMDAFASSSIPFHLVTRESFALIRSRLDPNGVMAINIVATGWDDVLVHSLAVTMQEVFEHVVVLPMAEPPNTLGNLVLLGSDRPLEPEKEPPVPRDRFSRDYTRAHAWDNRFRVEPNGVPVLTDDYNPVDIWSERIKLIQRKKLHEHLDAELSW